MAMDDPLRRTTVVAPRDSTPSAMIEATGLKCGVLIVVHDMTGLMMCRTETVRRPRITRGEHRHALAALKQRGVRLTDEQLIFDTIEAQRGLLEAAAASTKAARRQVERRNRSLVAAERHPPSPTVFADREKEATSLPLLAVEEWS